jgi:uncharacterized protein (DUF1501 family)
MKRRDFVKIGTLATTSLWVPKFLHALDGSNTSYVPAGNKVLVIVQFSGGNDGLNTVIPITNDLYFKNRPKLGIQKDKALSITTDLALNPELTAFEKLFKEGHLSIMNNVGYPNPDRSHFRSMDIWHSASDAAEYWSHGWLGRYLDHQCSGCDKPTYAVEVDSILSLALKGEAQNGMAFTSPKQLYDNANTPIFKEVDRTRKDPANEQPVDYLYKTLSSTLQSADYIFEQSNKKPTQATYPKTPLGNSFKTIASMIFSDINTKVYYVSLGSFDTHVNQQAVQARLFKQLNEAIDAFVKDLKENNRFNDVLTCTFSEFGRRVAQNASGGTDHGAASNMFFVSGGLKEKGVLNELPDLQNLINGDLKYTVDFKKVYATILNKWLGADDVAILKGSYDKLNFI